MLETLPHRPVEFELRQVLESAIRVTADHGVECFVGGAMARDILLTHVLGQGSIRATRDVDLGIFISNWDEFFRLKERLDKKGDFVAEDGNSHRLHYKTPKGVPLDLIPFGGVSSPDQTIAWPPGHDIVLNVTGFADAIASAVIVDLGEGLQVKTCSLPSLAVLKLLAWRDRGLQNNKDALDFALLLRLYGPAENTDRLYETEMEVLEGAGFDLELAGAHLLGKDAALQSSPDTNDRIKRIVEDPTLRQRLIDQLLRANAGLATSAGELRTERYVEAFISGFASKTK